MVRYKFLNGPSVEIIDEINKKYLIEYYERPDNSSKLHFVHSSIIDTVNGINSSSHFRSWFTKWVIKLYVIEDNRFVLVSQHWFNLKNKDVLIELFEDNEDAINEYNEIIHKFSEVHDCSIDVIMNGEQFDRKRDYYAKYEIGRFNIAENSYEKFGRFEFSYPLIFESGKTYDSFKNKTNWNNLTDRQVAKDILGYDIWKRLLKNDESNIDMKKTDDSYTDFYNSVLDLKETKLIEKLKKDIAFHFVDGATCDINKIGLCKNYRAEFVNTDTGDVEFTSVIEDNMYTKTNKKYFVNWKINVYDNDTNELLKTHKYSCENRRVYISIESKSLGDTLAWVPYVEEFRKKHNCTVLCSTNWNHLFYEVYPSIEFVPVGTTVRDIYALYRIGWFNEDNRQFTNPGNHRTQPLQKTCSDILGLEYREIRPKIKTTPISNIFISDKISEQMKIVKYVCLSIHSTAQAKYWNNKEGWQKVVDYITEKGYDIYIISKEGSGYMKNYHPKNSRVYDISDSNYSILEIMSILKGAEFFMGVSSGLAWLSWAVGTHSVMISGLTAKSNEFTDNITRIINEDVCNGCFNAADIVFDKGDWNWCPRHKHPSKQFICTKSITADKVIEKISTLVDN